MAGRLQSGSTAGLDAGSRSSAARRSLRRAKPMSEINVTPMVDVMLVLLIVFMVAAPLLTVGVPVDLPKTKAKPLTGDEEPLVVTINAKGHVFIQETKIDPTKLVAQLRAITDAGYDQRIYVRGDKSVAYGRVADTVARINSAGFTRVALVTEDPPKGAALSSGGEK